MKVVFIILCSFLGLNALAQAPFVGKLTYSVEIADTAMRDMFAISTMTIYTNDTIVRVETSTESLGTQILIQHIEKKKSYLLIETPIGNYAIQIPNDSTSTDKKYTFKKTSGSKEISGLKSSKLTVANKINTETFTFYYHKEIAAKYLPGFEDFPGLLTDYFVISKDGIYHHQLIEVKREPVSRDLFGIPSDYERISMDNFVDKMTQGANPSPSIGQ